MYVRIPSSNALTAVFLGPLQNEVIQRYPPLSLLAGPALPTTLWQEKNVRSAPPPPSGPVFLVSFFYFFYFHETYFHPAFIFFLIGLFGYMHFLELSSFGISDSHTTEVIDSNVCTALPLKI